MAVTTFRWWGDVLPLFDHPYNTTALNERAVEVPIAQHWLSDSGRTLEVGNVLSHYGIGPARRIVDRYEPGDGVENVDVFTLAGEFDQIVSISTVEHVRWDEPTDRDPGESAAAVRHLAGLLAPGGRMLVTAPTGWNPPLDDWFGAGSSGASRLCTIARRVDGWVQTVEPVVLPYGVQDPWAAAVWVAEWSA